MTDIITFRIIDLSSWDTLYIGFIFSAQEHAVKVTSQERPQANWVFVTEISATLSISV
jgi:hypothetical protein